MSVPNLAYIERYIKQVAPRVAHWVILVFFLVSQQLCEHMLVPRKESIMTSDRY